VPQVRFLNLGLRFDLPSLLNIHTHQL